MGLDARVYCDCFERNRLLSAPPPGSNPHRSDDGLLECGSNDLDTQIAFDAWQVSEACKHHGGMMTHERLGNIAHIAELRSRLADWKVRFPIIFSKVLYSGSHCGDIIDLSQIDALIEEISDLKSLQGFDEEGGLLIQEFVAKLRALADSAILTAHPIAF